MLKREWKSKHNISYFLFLVHSFLVSSVRAEMTEETNRTVELMDAIEQNSLHLYPVEPTPDTPFRAPSDNLTQKGGYLYLRRWGDIVVII